MSRCAISLIGLLVFVLLCVVSLAERPSSAALSENGHVSKENVHVAWDKGATAHEERLDKDEHFDDDADMKNMGEGNEMVLEQSDRSGGYSCPNICRPGWKGKKAAYHECRRSKCYHPHHYKYYKCVVKSCKYKDGYYFTPGWRCTCPYPY